jgi:hypothetical protein
VVERREASAPQGARRIARCGGYGTRLSAFRFPFFFVAWVERSETRERLRSVEVVPWVSLRSTQATNFPRMIVTASGPTTGAV